MGLIARGANSALTHGQRLKQDLPLGGGSGSRSLRRKTARTQAIDDDGRLTFSRQQLNERRRSAMYFALERAARRTSLAKRRTASRSLAEWQMRAAQVVQPRFGGAATLR